MGEIGCLAIAVAIGACAAFGALVGTAKESTMLGALFGLILGPFGVVAAGFLDGRSSCPVCRGKLYKGGEKCQHCGYDLTS